MHDITEFDKFVPFYSYTNAVGVVMGTGNVGPYLTHDPATTNTYLSRDGGLTWQEAHKGDFIYEFGNHGGLLMMADWAREATQAFFSTNQGYSWRGVQFSPQPLNVSNILTELSAMSTSFVVFGVRNGRGALYHVDFQSMGMRLCQGLSAADSASSDYETWTPSDGKSEERCLLGRQRLYRRRKQRAECLNNKDLEWPLQKRDCVCTDEDYECEAGFHRGVASMTCIPEHSTDFYKDSEGNLGVCAGAADNFEIDAYRKVSGDSCTGGWQPSKYSLPCNEIKKEALEDERRQKNPRHRRRKWFSLRLFIKGLVLILAITLLCCLARTETVRNCLISTRLKLAGQRDYSKPSSAPPSAANDVTNIGVVTAGDVYSPPTPTELKSLP
jgi:hypothetical protein